ncbi:MAG: pstS [Candidatus Eremiobacteraeota bacterium]|jgi:phosphate transport system substrate-binding protein|nr:pstS [Candidatus Eremiobacteraeota bacterium]
MKPNFAHVLAVLAAGIVSASAASGAAENPPVDPNLPAYQPKTSGVAPSPGAGYVLKDGSIQIEGAEHADFILERLDALFAKTHPGAKFALNLKGTGTGIPALTHGITPFAPMGRAVTPVELVPYAKIVGENPLEIKVAHTAFASKRLATSLAVYVNAANPIDKLSIDEVERMYTTGSPAGDITAWGQVGEAGEWKTARIRPVSGFAHAGFGNYETAKFHNRPFSGNMEAFPDTAQILQKVGQDRFAVGIAASGRTDPGIKAVALAEKPGGDYSTGSRDDVTNDKYTLGRYLYFYVRRQPGKPLDPFVKEYFRMMLSRDGQQIIASQADGYLPLTAHDAAEELAKLEEVK